MNGWAKLDMYNYLVLPGVIRIEIDSSNDPVLVDILSDIENRDGNIYVEGEYYSYLDEYEIGEDNGKHYLELSVLEYVVG